MIQLDPLSKATIEPEIFEIFVLAVFSYMKEKPFVLFHNGGGM